MDAHKYDELMICSHVVADKGLHMQRYVRHR